MMLVIMMIAIGASLVMATLQPAEKSRSALITVKQAEVLRTAITRYQQSHGGTVSGVFPEVLADLITDDATPCLMDNEPTNTDTYLSLQGWCGPYLVRDSSESDTHYKLDGWGTEFDFDSALGDLTSCGPDLICGGGDDIVFSP